MPTLVRLALVLGLAWAAGYGALVLIVDAVVPQQRQIVQTVSLPVAAGPPAGRSAATTLDQQASALMHGRRPPPAVHR